MSKRLSITLLVALQCVLLLIACAGWATQGNEGQDRPIAFGAIVLVVFAVGNAFGLLCALLAWVVALNGKDSRRDQ